MPNVYFRCAYLILDLQPEEINTGGLKAKIEVIRLVERLRKNVVSNQLTHSRENLESDILLFSQAES